MKKKTGPGRRYNTKLLPTKSPLPTCGGHTAGRKNKKGCCRDLPDDPPLVDQLAWGHLLENHLDGGAHRRLVGWGAREVGIEIDPRVGVQRHHCQVIGLIGHAPVEAAILDHDGGRDMASSRDLFPPPTRRRASG